MVNKLKRILCYLSSKLVIYILEKQLKASLSTLNNNIYIVGQLRFYNEVRKSFGFGKWTFLKCYNEVKK